MGGNFRAGMSRVLARLSVLAIGLAWLGAAAYARDVKELKPSDAQTVQALFVSDIHFEPFWDPAKVARLAKAPAHAWNAILAAPESADREAKFAQLQHVCPTRGEDSSYPLYRSSLKAMQANASEARFVVLSGDLISHSFSCKYTALFPKAAPGEYRAFVEKTIEFVMGELRGAFPGVPVYAALGNNDSDCGDYQLDANGKFLAAESNEFTRGFAAADRTQAARDFAVDGDYSVKLPAPMQRTRLLVLDDLFMSEKYQTCGGKEDAAPAAAQIAWLTQQLEDARKNKEKVWVMAHIPPGVDPYSTAAKAMSLCAGSEPKMFLSSEALPETMAKYGNVIRLAIFAHTHMDEVRWLAPLDGSTGKGGVAVKLVPSISPIGGNNPAFTVAAIDAATAVMKDYRVIAASNKTGVGTAWTEEYDFADAYREPEFSAATLQDLVERFEADRDAQTSASQSYIRNYDVGRPLRELGPLWPAYVCALKNHTGAAFTSCVCGTLK